MSNINFGLVAACLAAVLAAAGCKEEEKDYTCDEAMDKMYDEDCELYCSWDDYGLYLDTCAWWDDGDPANFSKSVAEDICEDVEDLADDEDCLDEFQDMLNCLAKNAGDDCAEDCEDAWEDLVDCLF